MKTLAILGDMPTAATGFAVVLSNLADELSRYFRVIYFGRFGQATEFASDTDVLPGFMFEYVPCQGGVWDRELVVRILNHYNEIDIVFSEDDWFSAYGMVQACNFHSKPLHFLTPIDSLPISKLAFGDIFSNCDKIYVPNSSYKMFDKRERFRIGLQRVRERAGEHLKSVFLPHGVRSDIFRPKRVKRDKRFTFIWTGRAEQRKAPGRVIKAFERVYKNMDAILYMRTDWTTPNGQQLLDYIVRKNLPIEIDQTEDVPHVQIADVYNKGDIFICSSMAGGFEMGVTEAAACGIPSIVTDWTFMNENVVDGKTGILVSCESFTHPRMAGHASEARKRIWGQISIEKLAETMYWSYLNQEEVRTMGINARGHVTDNFKWESIASILARELSE